MDESMSESDLYSSDNSANKAKKRRKNNNSAQNKRKRRREQGRGYVTVKNKIEIPPKKFVHTTNCCKQKCHKKFNLVVQKEKYQDFYKLDGKSEQDSFLMCCSEKIEIKNSSKNPKTTNRQFSWSYSLTNNGKKEHVCKTFLQKVFQLSDGRMKTVLRFCKQGFLSASENRGSHQNRPRTIPDAVWEMVKEHWSSFPSKTSHYSFKKTKRRYFDNPDLNITILYDLFKEHYKKKPEKICV